MRLTLKQALDLIEKEKIRITNLPKFIQVHPFYCIEPQFDVISDKLTKTQLSSIHKIIQREVAKIPNAKYMFGVSTVDSGGAKRITEIEYLKKQARKKIRKGEKVEPIKAKRGRPKVIITGKKIRRHAHILLYIDEHTSANELANTLVTKVDKYIKKQFDIKNNSLTVHKHSYWGVDIANYIYRQSKPCYTNSDYFREIREYMDMEDVRCTEWHQKRSSII